MASGVSRHSKCTGTILLFNGYGPGIQGRILRSWFSTLWTGRLRWQLSHTPRSGHQRQRSHIRGHTRTIQWHLLGRFTASSGARETEIRTVRCSNVRARGIRSKIYLYLRQLRQKLFRRMGEDATYQVHTLSTDNRLPRMQL